MNEELEGRIYPTREIQLIHSILIPKSPIFFNYQKEA